MLLAVVDEQACVGCAKCLEACPVDAILGAQHFMHTVLTEECIGCQLCVPPCPMDCIELIEQPVNNKGERAQKAKQRYQARQQRLASQAAPQLPPPDDPKERLKIQEAIQAAVARVEKRKKS